MIETLSKQQKKSLRKASRTQIQSAFVGLKSNFRNSRWVTANNRYTRAAVARIKKDLATTPPNVNAKHLTDYIAASVPLHLLDGWSFLGRALDAAGRGDADAARHLAYYAELRAAVSLLSHEGFGVFSNQHIIVDATLGVAPLAGRRGTHVVTWLALDHWANLQKSADLTGGMVEAFGSSLTDWVDAVSAGSMTFRPVASRWLKRWGLDLRRMTDDREARNEASYRPTELGSPQRASISEVVRFLHDLWHVCEPASSGRFHRMDQFLLRRTLAHMFEAVHGVPPSQRPQDYERMVLRGITNLSLSSQEPALSFLTFRSVPTDPLVISLAEKSDDITSASHHLQVMARALLLLRVATGASRNLARAALISETEMSFWWEKFGLERGLWAPGSVPDSLSDQWSDMEGHVEDLAEWATTTPQQSFAGWRADQPSVVAAIGACERIGLWGLGL